MTKPHWLTQAVTLTPLAFLLWAAPAGAACPSDEAVRARFEAYITKQPVESYGEGLSIEDGYCAQAKYVALLQRHFGAPVGYKVGFTGKASQERFGVTEPVYGVLFGPMLLRDGTTIAADFGLRPLFEPDLIVTVKDAGIMDARTPLDAARHLDEVIPFIELPDIVVPKGQPLTAGVIIALDVLPRYGVLGEPVKVQPTEAFVEAFANMRVTLRDDKGNVYDQVQGNAILGNPLNAVLWLVENLKKRGQTLKAGDVVSLGSLGKLHPTEAGKTITLRYDGLPGGTRQANVHLR